MACIIWQTAEGSEYSVKENQPHNPSLGSFNTGRVDWDCDGEKEMAGDEVHQQFTESGVQWGDAIKWVTNRIGVKQCSACKARQEILNHAKKNGWVNTLKQIKGTF